LKSILALGKLFSRIVSKCGKTVARIYSTLFSIVIPEISF
jgi:hypothetical protein